MNQTYVTIYMIFSLIYITLDVIKRFGGPAEEYDDYE